MFAILATPPVVMSAQQKFKKFGKDVTDQRKSELSKIGDAFKNIADEEKTRAKKLFDDHKKRGVKLNAARCVLPYAISSLGHS